MIVSCGINLSVCVVTTDASGNMERPSGSSFRDAGTFPYISPEQNNPNREKKLDSKTDIFSLGIILFELHYPKMLEEEDRTEVTGLTPDTC